MHHNRDVPMGGVAPPIFSNLQESWSKVNQALRGFATVFSVSFSFSNNLVNNIWGQLVITPPPPPTGVSEHYCTTLPVNMRFCYFTWLSRMPIVGHEINKIKLLFTFHYCDIC